MCLWNVIMDLTTDYSVNAMSLTGFFASMYLLLLNDCTLPVWTYCNALMVSSVQMLFDETFSVTLFILLVFVFLQLTDA